MLPMMPSRSEPRTPPLSVKPTMTPSRTEPRPPPLSGMLRAEVVDLRGNGTRHV